MSSPPTKERKVRGSSRAKRDEEAASAEHHIETANKLSDVDFISKYLRPVPDWTQWTHTLTGNKYTLSLSRPQNLGDIELDDCFNLVQQTSGHDYRKSSQGWHPVLKRKEMRSPDLRYILVRDEKHESVWGFTSMMPTFENGEPVVYVYEIHIRPEIQGTGLGQELMNHVLSVASEIPSIKKVMLTCFVSNERGRQFYEKIGFQKDESSPRDRKLRGGKVVTSDYVILSRSIKGQLKEPTCRITTEEII